VGDAKRKGAPGREVHVLAVELRDLLGLEADARCRRRRRHQIRHADLCRAVGEGFSGRRGQAGNGASGAEHDH
jgi:hypothetical protein